MCSLYLEYISVWNQPSIFIHSCMTHSSNTEKLACVQSHEGSVAACGSWLPYWTAQLRRMGLLMAGSHRHHQGTYKRIELFEGRDYYSQHFPRIALRWGKRGLQDIDMKRIVQLCLRKTQRLGEIRAALGHSRASLLCNIKHQSSNRGFSNETWARMNVRVGEMANEKKKKKNKKGKE